MRLSDPRTTEYILLPEKVRYVMQHLELLNPVSRLIISTWRKRRICLKLCNHTNIKTIKKIQGNLKVMEQRLS